MRIVAALCALALLVACAESLPIPADLSMQTNITNAPPIAKATFAGGCFWCMEPPFEREPGVTAVISGYTGGHTENPTYEDVNTETTGHVEAVEIHYDPQKVSYERLLEIFWEQIDPTDDGGSFVDRGPSYRSAIFTHSDEQQRLAEESKRKLAASGIYGDKPIVTEIHPASPFYRAEEYHQDYYKKNPLRYKYYRGRSGRDEYLQQTWDNRTAAQVLEGPMEQGETTMIRKPSQDELKQKLTPLQYTVTQEKGTEPAFKNAYWDNEADGIYVDVVSGEPLFSSEDKFDSGTGWPSFSKPITPQSVLTEEDRSWLSVRTEVKSAEAGSHLGHVFDDGPEPTGKRYCMNSAALRFVPKEQLEKEGYEEYLKLFA